MDHDERYQNRHDRYRDIGNHHDDTDTLIAEIREVLQEPKNRDTEDKDA